MRAKKINFKVSALNFFLDTLATCRHRQLFWLQGDSAWCRQQAVVHIQSAGWQQGCWITASGEDLPLSAWGLPSGFRQLAARKSRQQLGQEEPCLVIDAFTGFNPDALGAVAGCLRAGGLLFLLTPKNWSGYPDPDYRRLAPWPWAPEALTRRFLQRTENLLQSQPVVNQVQGQLEPSYPPLSSLTEASPSQVSYRWGAITADQEAVVAGILHQWSEQSDRAQVVTADRGRGKSWALGLAAAAWLELNPHDRLLVTAPSTQAAARIFEGYRVRLQQLGAAHLEAQLIFIAPDALLQELPAARFLLIDEAAALPVPVLIQLLACYPGSLFATTQQGYEGNGRGFALRFYGHLNQASPGWAQRVLKTPVRWASHDPLEACVNRLLLLDANPPLPPAGSPEVTFSWLSLDLLAKDEALLSQVFGLLVLAHYRTSPDDLRQLLDTPGVRLAAVCMNGLPIALAWVQEEGGMDAELAEAVHLGQRRPQGHLLAQSLSFHAGFPQAARLRWWRIQRLLVHPEKQRQGWGGQLLNWVKAEAGDLGASGPDLLGTSFGATPQLLPFWLQAGYQAVRLGLTRDQASGEHTLQMVQGLSPDGLVLQEHLVRRFAETLPDQLRLPFMQLPGELLKQLPGRQEATRAQLTVDDRRELKAFAKGHRPWVLTLTALKRWFTSLSAKNMADHNQEVQVWQALLVEERPVTTLIEDFSLQGKKHLERWLKASYLRITEHQE